MSQSSPEELPALLDGYERVVAVGIGRNTALAAALVDRGVSVIATDVRERTVPDGVEFVLDDVTAPDRSVYADAGAIVAQRLPPELQRPVFDLARDVGADLFFTTLGADPVLVPTEVVSTARGPVFVATRK